MSRTRRNRSNRSARSAAALAVAGLLAAAPAAHGDSIVFVRDGNVWLTEPDGSRLHQVTTDGTPAAPYRSPSQADDGTIAVSHGQLIKRLRQNGELIDQVDPFPLVDSVSNRVDGVPIAVAISPDGSKVAWSFASVSCPIVWECGARGATGVMVAGRPETSGSFSQSTFVNPRWIGNARLLVTGGYNYHVNTIDVAPGSQPVHWFDDRDFFGDSSDMGEGAVSRDGRRVAAVHGYDGEWPGSVRRIIWMNSAVDVRTGPPPVANPEAVCVTGPVRGLHNPTWSPDGTGLAFAHPEGLHVARVVPTDPARCGEYGSAVLVPGASEPDWGPTAVAPTPRQEPRGPDPRGPEPRGPDPRGPEPRGPEPRDRGPEARDGGKATVRLATATRLKAALRGGLRVRVRGAGARRRVTASAAVDRTTAQRTRLGRRAVRVASGSATATARGEAVVRLRFSKRAVRALRGQKRVTLVVTTSRGGKLTATLR
jgi:hypothetical protein